jgi:hypothetical protein
VRTALNDVVRTWLKRGGDAVTCGLDLVSRGLEGRLLALWLQGVGGLIGGALAASGVVSLVRSIGHSIRLTHTESQTCWLLWLM